MGIFRSQVPRKASVICTGGIFSGHSSGDIRGGGEVNAKPVDGPCCEEVVGSGSFGKGRRKLEATVFPALFFAVFPLQQEDIGSYLESGQLPVVTPGDTNRHTEAPFVREKLVGIHGRVDIQKCGGAPLLRLSDKTVIASHLPGRTTKGCQVGERGVDGYSSGHTFILADIAGP